MPSQTTMKIHLFDKDVDPIHVPAGQAIFAEGDAADCMYAVQSGAVDIRFKGQVLETVEAGGVFGEMALIENTPRIATAVAKAETNLVKIDRQRLMFLVQQAPFFALQLMTVMAQRLRRMDERL